MYYVPWPSLAYDSLRSLTSEVPVGALMRGLHFWGASFVVVAAVVHLLRVFLFGAYKAPREMTWITGVVMLLVILGFSLSGYLQPWDQKAWSPWPRSKPAAPCTPFVDFLREFSLTCPVRWAISSAKNQDRKHQEFRK